MLILIFLLLILIFFLKLYFNKNKNNDPILINKISGQMRRKTSIGVRLNPDINAPTHKKISTGKAEDKFGMSKKNLISF